MLLVLIVSVKEITYGNKIFIVTSVVLSLSITITISIWTCFRYDSKTFSGYTMCTVVSTWN